MITKKELKKLKADIISIVDAINGSTNFIELQHLSAKFVSKANPETVLRLIEELEVATETIKEIVLFLRVNGSGD